MVSEIIVINGSGDGVSPVKLKVIIRINFGLSLIGSPALSTQDILEHYISTMTTTYPNGQRVNILACLGRWQFAIGESWRSGQEANLSIGECVTWGPDVKEGWLWGCLVKGRGLSVLEMFEKPLVCFCDGNCYENKVIVTSKVTWYIVSLDLLALSISLVD